MLIRSSKTSLKFANLNKKKTVLAVLAEYKAVVEKVIDILWLEDDVKPLCDKEILSRMETWLSARMKQCAGKQASGIVRGTRKKQKQRLWVIRKLTEEGKTGKARKLQVIHDRKAVVKPSLKTIEMELDARMVKINLDNATKFDGWISLASIGEGIRLRIPFKRTKHFNKLMSQGKLKDGVRLGKDDITFRFEMEDKASVGTKTVGIDIGVRSLLSVDDGTVKVQSRKDIHGHDLDSINTMLARKQKGSKSFLASQQHRTNYVNWSINRLNWKDFGEIRLERIRHLRYKTNTSRKLKHFTYGQIFDRLRMVAGTNGVRVSETDPAFTSQRCCQCGWTRKSNRKGELFRCGNCGHTENADMNASTNIRLNLRQISTKERQARPNKEGFFWCAQGQEPIVPDVRRTG